jgi:N-sulfoglucosamine sulfohydrolase
MDQWAAGLIQQLKDDGLYESTIIIFWSDHGVGLPRSKRWLYNSGTHIPLVIRIPEAFRTSRQGEPGTVSNTLISSIDFGPTMMNLAGIEIPEHIQGQTFLGRNLPDPRPYVYACRDRMDERYDIIRTVRNHRYLYVRNYEPLKTFYQYMNTPEQGATMKELRRLHESGKLPPAAEFFFSPTKPVEELYDYLSDPHNLKNLASNPKHSMTLNTLRQAHLTWTQDTKDLGLIPEPIIAERVKKFGSEHAILRQSGSDSYNKKLSAVAIAASSGPTALKQLMAACEDADSAIRYWGAVGIGNIGEPALKAAQELMTSMIKDGSSTVRTAAARALCQMEQPAKALPVLINELTTGAQWERLHAAIVLDEIDEKAMPVAEQMKQGLTYQKDFNSQGKYRVRVINRALNELHGTQNKVK